MRLAFGSGEDSRCSSRATTGELKGGPGQSSWWRRLGKRRPAETPWPASKGPGKFSGIDKGFFENLLTVASVAHSDSIMGGKYNDLVYTGMSIYQYIPVYTPGSYLLDLP